jgi:hypothetical protein
MEILRMNESGNSDEKFRKYVLDKPGEYAREKPGNTHQEICIGNNPGNTHQEQPWKYAQEKP